MAFSRAPPAMYVMRLAAAGPLADVWSVSRVTRRILSSGRSIASAASWVSMESLPSPGSATAP